MNFEIKLILRDIKQRLHCTTLIFIKDVIQDFGSILNIFFNFYPTNTMSKNFYKNFLVLT